MSKEHLRDRRGFLQENVRAIGRLFTDIVNEAVVGTTGGKRHLRPPGAIDEAAFLLTCTRCGDCADVCPSNTIKFLPPSAGTAVGTPYIDPLEQPCDLCGKCMPVCEPQALLTIADPRQVRIGTAVIDPNHCWAHKGMICELCVNRCPFPDEAIKMAEGKPIVATDICTGCGLCAYVCPSTPSAIQIQPRT